MLSNSEGSIHTPIKVRCARILHRKLLYKAGGALSALIHLGYLGMFLSAFLAATILPFSSEIVLSALYSSGLSWLLLLVVFTVLIMGAWTSNQFNVFDQTYTNCLEGLPRS